MKEQPIHSYMARAVHVLAPLMQARSAALARRRTQSKKRLKDMKRAAPWFLYNNVVGVIVSRKTSGQSRERGDLCVKFLVRRKIPLANLPEAQIIPPVVHLESVGRELPTDVEVRQGVPRSQRLARIRPVTPGVSVGDPRSEGGTLGLIVRRETQPFYLSCAHVLASGGRSASPVGRMIEQPSDEFSRHDDDAIGTLEDFTELDPAGASVDAAIALPNTVAFDPEVPGIGVPEGILPNAAADFIDDNMIVMRNGIGSGMQEGSIDGFGSVKLFYPDLGETVTLNDQVIYNASNAGGDSGAAVFIKGTKLVVGLHVGEMGGTGQSVFTPIRAVFDALQLELET